VSWLVVLGVSNRWLCSRGGWPTRLGGAMAGAAVVHSDDVAWEHSRFGSDDLMVDGVLRRGEAARGAP
jgi:hypothetical protein